MLVAASGLALAVVLGALLVFQPGATTSTGVRHWLAWELAGRGVPYQRASVAVEYGLNVALFVPGAFAAGLLWPGVRWWQWVLVGLAVSAGIEAVQGALLPSRQAEARDLVANTVGAALGAGAAVLLRVASRPGTSLPDATV